MLILRDLGAIRLIPDQALRARVTQRLGQVCVGETYDVDRHGEFVIVEPGDTVPALEQVTRCPLLTDPYSDCGYGHPDYTPSFDLLENHHDCYEILFIGNDDGAATTILVPKAEGIAADLLALCAEYAVPAAEPIGS